MQKRTYWADLSSPIIYAAIKYFAAWVIVTLTQLLFYLCNAKFVPICEASVLDLVKGILIYSIATTSILLTPFILLTTLPLKKLPAKKWYRILSESTYIIPVLFSIIVGCCNAPYYQFTYRRLSSQIFTYLTNCGDYGLLIPHFITDYCEAIVGIITLTIILIIICRKIHFNKTQYEIIHIKNSKSWKRNGYRYFLFVITFLFLYVTTHWGFKKQLIDSSDTGRFCNITYSSLIVPDALNIINTLINNDINTFSTIQTDTESNLFNPKFVAQPDTNDTISQSTIIQNVVLLILESFSQEYMGCYNKDLDSSHTPFLDSLSRHSLKFQGQANGKQSIEGIPAILSSLPTLIEAPYLNSKYYKKHHRSLPQIMSEHGYHTAFYHGGENGIMNFDKYCHDIGFSYYYGENEYYKSGGLPKDHNGSWGIYDHPYMQYFADQLKESPQPFFCCAYTLTSHHPYAIPDTLKQHYAEGNHPILKCVEYTDNAIRHFFEAVKNEPWFKNTLFIITSDHSGPNIDKTYIKNHGLYSIPLIIYNPSDSCAKTHNRIVQQTDIMPTIIDHIGIQDSAICFGTSFYQNTSQGWSIVYGNGVYTLRTTNGILQFNNKSEQYTATTTSEQDNKDSIKLSQLGKSIVYQYNKYLTDPQQPIKEKQ